MITIGNWWQQVIVFSTLLCDPKSFYMLGNSWLYKLKKNKVLSLSLSLSVSVTHTHTHTHTHNDMMDKMLKYKVSGDASLREEMTADFYE